MPDLNTIATIERSSAQLSRLVELWTSNRETAINDYLANPGNYRQPPSFNLELLDLAARILWRLTAVQKTLDTLRTPADSSPSDPNRPPSTSSTSSTPSTLPMSASADTSLHPASAGVPADADHSPAGFSRLPSTGLQPSNCSIPTLPIIPTIPCVPTIPSLISDAQLHAIATEAETLFQETQSLAADLGIDVSDTPDTLDPLDLSSLDEATHSLQSALKNIFPKPT